MTVSRRLFIRAATGAAVIVSIPQALVNTFGQDKRKGTPAPPAEGAAHRKPLVSYNDPLYYYSSTAYSSYIGSIFRVHVSNWKCVDLELIDVSQLQPAVPGKEGFSLLFQDSAAERLSSGLYKIEHSALGTLSMMIGPVNQNGTTYEVVINRQYP